MLISKTGIFFTFPRLGSDLTLNWLIFGKSRAKGRYDFAKKKKKKKLYTSLDLRVRTTDRYICRTHNARYRDCYICCARIMHEWRVCERDIAVEIGAARKMEKPRRRGMGFVTPRTGANVASLPRANATCTKVAEDRSPWGIPQLLHYTHAAISSVCWHASLLYYIAKSAAFRCVRVQKCSAREATTSTDRPTLRNRRARLSTVAELRQLDKTAASEASRPVKINPDTIVPCVSLASVKRTDARVYLCCLRNFTRRTARNWIEYTCDNNKMLFKVSR